MQPPMKPRSKTASELSDYLAYLVVYAPDLFPAWRKLTLESAFDQLFIDLHEVSKTLDSASLAQNAKEQAEQALLAYRSNDCVKGAHLLQSIMQSLKAVRHD